MFKLFFIFILFSLNQCSMQYEDLNGQHLFRYLQKKLKDKGITLDDVMKELKPHIEQASLFDFSRQADLNMNAEEMIRYRGYEYEEHYAVTEDCYILTLNRIINQHDLTPNKPPVLLQHGLLDSATGWIINTLGGRFDDSDYKNLGFALAKLGFDVWLGNFRGSTYSKNHTVFKSNERQFWKFTYDNHALQDLPAQIAKIQEVTGYNQIGYVGFSQGTATMFELLSMKPEIADTLSAYVALAPIAFVGNITSPVRYFAKIPGLIRLFLYLDGPFFENSLFYQIVLGLSCRSFSGVICEDFIDLFMGYSTDQLDNSRLPVYFKHLPAGTSFANIARFGQLVKSGRFEMLDYLSADQNLKCYNQTTPPQIPLGNIRMPKMYIMNGKTDKFSVSEDVDKLRSELKVNAYWQTVEYDNFNHLDFVLSQHDDIYVNRYAINFLQNNPPRLDEGLRLKQYTRKTCIVPDSSSYCHMNLDYVLKNMIDSSVPE